jgi:ABC-type Fe3+ transport system permease subunit
MVRYGFVAPRRQTRQLRGRVRGRLVPAVAVAAGRVVGATARRHRRDRLAYLLAKGRFRGRGLLEAIVTVPIVLPPTVLGYYLLTTLGVNSPIGQAWEDIFGRPLVFTPPQR